MSNTKSMTTSNVQLARCEPTIAINRTPSNKLHEIVEPVLISQKPKIRNWGGTFTSTPACLFQPKTVLQCCAIIELARRMGNIECRALGRGHSPGDLPFTQGWLLQMDNLSGLVAIDTSVPTATVLAGTYVSDMHGMLENAAVPLGMPNLGSISEQTIGGLISTATHGTGYSFPVISAAVESMRIICALDEAEGGTQVISCSRKQNADLFNATLCGLGATGLLVEVTIKVDHWFKLKQISEECKFEDLIGPETSTPSIATYWSADQMDEHTLPMLQSRSKRAALKGIQKAKELIGVNEDSVDANDGLAIKRPMSLGKLLAHKPHLVPGCPASRLPKYHTKDPSSIYPIDSVNSEIEKDELDEETRVAQSRLETLGQSSQHVRIAWVPHAGMCTVMRMNKTLEPIQAPGVFSRVYGRVVGYHFLQLLIFMSRYRPSMLGNVNRFAYWLTHPSRPSDPSESSVPAKPIAADANQKAITEDPSQFANGTFDPTRLGSSSSLNRDPEPLNPTNPRSVLVDAAPRVFNFDCLFQQYTNEWAIPLSCLGSTLRAMRDWLKEEEEISKRGGGEQVHFPVEIRFVDADGIWLSPCHGRKTVYIGIVQYRPYDLPIKYRSLFAKFEVLMRHFGGRPHWAKAHTCGPTELARLYPNLSDFLALRKSKDPDGIFLNPYVRRHLLGDLRAEASPRIFKSRL
ncbi:uncharacterized protein FA14DRAFT_159303 [Meira miltonrushii]|uniref:D-arabinono-1,4-lactone oxidase n=1 Tax=Meira miltonrushii TaxID=1280837 RepID=A0A316VHV2_9BASI|nr:uncharacterized protein FA14DRAFT_159303 [Meira miltonrushii]PWN37110.1 hypothetical protein FA14DRAFT_159303 [Meira miltonrushii]